MNYPTFHVTTKRQAIAAVREEANAVIEQLERRANGWDRGMYRDDDTMRTHSVRARIASSVTFCFRISDLYRNA